MEVQRSVLGHPGIQGVTVVASPVPNFFAGHGIAVPGSCQLSQTCESAQAGRRNNHKTTDEMQRVNLFSLPCHPGDPLAWTKLSGACIPTCVLLPGSCFGDPLVGEEAKISLLFAFRPWCGGCSCVLSVLTLTHTFTMVLQN